MKGHDLPESDEFKSFGDASTKVLIGDLTVIQKYLEDHQQLIIDSYLEQDRRHSAIQCWI